MKLDLDAVQELELTIKLNGEEQTFEVFDISERLRLAIKELPYENEESIPCTEYAQTIRKVVGFDEDISVKKCFHFLKAINNAISEFMLAKNE